MDTEDLSQKTKIHNVLGHSYSTYFVLFLAGLFLDLFFPLRLFNRNLGYVGIALIIFASLLIYWAQHTSRNYKKGEVTKKIFYGGPYRFSRGPTHWGLFFLIFGFGLLVNGFFISIAAVIAMILGKAVFLPKEEDLLAKKYGEPYLEYKKSIKL
ncbi:MAG TPA: methyltransferase [Candidatus Paceibacterota bacterium]|jgi:protein-S-isoprenylcysteine O-methyltransferase Ste14|nr:methyltransferase [Candidatus Paceibacterota bacterium]